MEIENQTNRLPEFKTKKEFLKFLSTVDISTLPKEQQDQVTKFLEKQAIQKAQEDLYSYIKLIGPIITDGFQTGRHIELICLELQDLAERMWDPKGLTVRKMLSMPPGASKSQICSRLFPSWVLGRWPKARIIIVGHGIEFAKAEYGSKVRDILRMEEFQKIFPGVELRPDKQTEGRFLTTQGGELLCGSLEAKIAGRRGHLVICDDALVEDDAMSRTVCAQLVQKYMPNIRSRLLTNPACAELMVGCLTANTDILLADGTIEKINNLVGKGNISVMTRSDTGKLEPRKMVKAWSVGEDEVYELKTVNSDPIRGNARHPFLLDTGEWKQLSEIKAGDRLVIRKCRSAGKKTSRVTNKEAWLLGFMFGDGWLTYNKKRYVTCVAKSAYDELNTRVLGTLKDCTGYDFYETKFGYYRSDCKFPYKYFEKLGLCGKAKTKRIPKWVFSEPRRIREQFLLGFISADGFDGGNFFTVELANYLLVQDLKELAWSVGRTTGNIRSRVRIQQAPNSPKPTEAYSASISISYGVSCEEFTYTKVKSNIKLAEKEEVFDLEVEGNHNFIANGLVVHNTRWCPGDLFDYMLEQDKNSPAPWEVLKIPALLDEELSERMRKKGDPEGYLAPGTSFWPEFQSTEKLLMLQASYLNNIGRWNATYMQSPVVMEGNLIDNQDFKHWKFSKPPECKSLIITADTAYTKNTQSDFSAIQLWGIFTRNDGSGNTRPNCILLDARKGKWDFPELCAIFVDLYYRKKPDAILLEHKASGLALVPELRNRGLPIIEFKSTKDKFERMQAASPLVKSGIFWVPMPNDRPDICQKSMEFVNEVSMFPAGTHDDVADSFSQFVLFARDSNMLIGDGYTNTEDFFEEEQDYIGSSYTAALL